MDNGASSYRHFLDGDESGFNELLDLYRDSLIFFINQHVHNLTVAEDLAEDSFLELLIHKNRYNFHTSLKTYLFTIGRNKALNFLKLESKIAPLDIENTGNEVIETLSLEERVLNTEQNRALRAAIENLKYDYRMVIHLVHFENLTYEEAAKVMNKNRKQVENLLFLAKGCLKTTLIKEDFQL